MEDRRFAWRRGTHLGAAFAPNGKWFALHGFSKTVEIIDAAQGTCVARAKVEGQLVKRVNFSTDGARFVAATDNGAFIAETATGRVLSHVAPGMSVETAALGTMKERVYTAHADLTVRVWEAAPGRAEVILRGHNQVPSGILELDAGRLLLTWGNDNALILWNAEDGTLLLRMETDRRGIVDAVMAEGGAAILLVDRNGVVWRYRCDACRPQTDLITMAHRTAGTAGRLNVGPRPR